MSLPALLLFIFAPFLSALVRVRVVAVLSALIVAASLSVAAPAEARLSGWRPNCKTDEWDDSPSCVVRGFPVEFTPFVHFPVMAYRCESAGEQSLSVVVTDKATFPFGGFERSSGEWESGESFTLHKIQIRWDKEPASDGIMLQEGDEDTYAWWWGNAPSDWWGWKALKMTPTTFPNPIRLLQEKSQLRIRYWQPNLDEPKVLTYPLADARGAIAKAKRHCGL